MLRVAIVAAALLAPVAAQALPVASIPGFLGIRVYEQTTSVTGYALSASSSIARQPALGAGGFDFAGAGGEYYDVFASDAAGVADAAGEFISIEVRFDNAGGGGGNINGVGLNRTSEPELLADVLASFSAFGAGASPLTVGRAVDGDITAGANTTLGSTLGTSDLLRVTVGWSEFASTPSTAVPLPPAGLLMLGGLALLAARRRRA